MWSKVVWLRHGKLAHYERARCMGQACFTRQLVLPSKIATMYTIRERTLHLALVSVVIQRSNAKGLNGGLGGDLACGLHRHPAT